MVAYTFNHSIWNSQAFNPITSEVKAGRDVAGSRKEYKTEETGAQRVQSEDL